MSKTKHRTCILTSCNWISSCYQRLRWGHISASLPAPGLCSSQNDMNPRVRCDDRGELAWLESVRRVLDCISWQPRYDGIAS